MTIDNKWFQTGSAQKPHKQNWKYFNIMQDVETLQHQNNTGGFSLQRVSESCHRLVILGMITNI